MFCSLQCREQVKPMKNKYEWSEWTFTAVGGSKVSDRVNIAFHSADEIRALYSAYQNVTVFDFNFKNISIHEKARIELMCLFGLAKKPFEAMNSSFDPSSNSNETIALVGTSAFLNNFTQLIYMKLNPNDSDIVDEGKETSLFGSLFNHSCDPNVQAIFVDNKKVYYATRNIKANEQLFVSYL